MAFPSDTDLKWALQSNVIKDCPLSVADIRTATMVYGKSIAMLKGKTLAPHVADVSPTCRRHRQMSPNLGRHCVSLRHRRGPDIPNLYQLLPTSTNQPKHTGTLAIIEFLCLSSNNNHEIYDMSGIPRHVVKCRVVLDTLPTRHFLVSAT